MTDEDKTRVQEIIKLARKLKWAIKSPDHFLPLFQLSEVEKCMLAMVDDTELERMRTWVKNKGD